MTNTAPKGTGPAFFQSETLSRAQVENVGDLVKAEIVRLESCAPWADETDAAGYRATARQLRDALRRMGYPMGARQERVGMTEQETAQELQEISARLRNLANANNGNAAALDSILAADSALCDYLKPGDARAFNAASVAAAVGPGAGHIRGGGLA